MTTYEEFSFETYVTDWFNEFLDNNKDLTAIVDEVFAFICGSRDILVEDETEESHLRNLDADEIYNKLINPNADCQIPGLPDFYEF